VLESYSLREGDTYTLHTRTLARTHRHR